MKIYRIRNKDTGLFRTKGSWSNDWNKQGRIFKRKCDLVAHLKRNKNFYKRNPNVEIVSYEVDLENGVIEDIQFETTNEKHDAER